MPFAEINSDVNVFVGGICVKPSVAELLDAVRLGCIRIERSVPVLVWDEVLKVINELAVGEVRLVEEFSQVTMGEVFNPDFKDSGWIIESEVDAINDFRIWICREFLHELVRRIDDVREDAPFSLGINAVGVGILVLEALEKRDVIGIQKWVVSVSRMNDLDVLGKTLGEHELLIDPSLLVGWIETEIDLVGIFRWGFGAQAGLNNEPIIPGEFVGLFKPNVIPFGRFDFLGIVDG